MLADWGFTVEEEVATKGVNLKLPKFTKGRKKMPTKDVDFSRKIAKVGIHVQRVVSENFAFCKVIFQLRR